ncbi:MAG: flavin reductase family protein [Synergistaceae bacterium]|nr:flavin reductase family protein [Synergistaceae bacterium]MDD3673729.1 flavin reductase family protein [Synergistaceae bacterium]MDD3962828.1 flavin reductase family protein [Synergistaceae bacterium]MDD4705390.1 flavin reductase family protein [Synergistaceae bacterium]MDD5421072.1 flavin reductase family protein [Synergistaceae bacterium]
MTWKPGTMLYPIPPVMVSCGTMEKPNVITVAWTGIVNSDPAMTYISVRPERYSHELIMASSEFVINLTTEPLMWTADYCGVKSGRDIDKFSLPAITAIAASEVSAPMIEESPINIECRVDRILRLGTHDMFLSKIIAVNADEKLIDSHGKLHLEKARLVATSHGKYFSLGRQIGTFGYSVKKKR